MLLRIFFYGFIIDTVWNITFKLIPRLSVVGAILLVVSYVLLAVSYTIPANKGDDK